MRLKLLYAVCQLCCYLRLFKFSFSSAGLYYVKMLVHAMIYLEGQTNCLRTTEYWHKKVAHQRVIEFMNWGKYDLNSLNHNRFHHLLPFALKHNAQDVLADYALFSIDPSAFKKYKNKKMQGVHYTGDSTGTFKAHTMVMSSFIIGESTIPFKKILYWGKKGVPKGRQLPKSRLFVKLGLKAEKVKISGKKKLAVFDAEGCSKKVLPYFHKSEEWTGFLTKFPRTRNIIINDQKIHIRKYLDKLTQADYKPVKLKGEVVFCHMFEAEVSSLSFLGKCRFVVIQNEAGNLAQEELRVLITDVKDLTTEQIVLIYLRRWKQETYHQILKDRLGIKSYKHRRLKAIMRWMELGDLAFSFLEYVRLKKGSQTTSLSEIRNQLIQRMEREISLKYSLPMPKRLCHAKKTEVG